MVQKRKILRALAAKDQKNASQTSPKGEHGARVAAPSPSSSSSKGLFDLPPELRNKIYRYVLASDKPIKVQGKRVGRSSSRYRFTMIPGLILASKQLKCETQRFYLEENEFEVTDEVLEHHGMAPLFAIRQMHQNVGLEIESLHIHRELKKTAFGGASWFKADFTLSRADGRVTIVKQVYASAICGGVCDRVSPDPLVNVCGCDMVKCAQRFSCGDIVFFLQWLSTHRWTPDRQYSRMIKGLIKAIVCPRCSTPRQECMYF